MSSNAEEIKTDDGSVMVYIPAGEFVMGKNKSVCDGPEHKVYLDAYYIDKYLITRKQYERFVKDARYKAEGKWRRLYARGTEDHPVVSVTWNDAQAYAQWAGKILPTEAQWEKAARGTDGRIYPWGSRWQSQNCCCWKNGNRGTSSVGSFPKDVSPYGCYDMAGNVSEWLDDWASAEDYPEDHYENPHGPDHGDIRCVRGGHWFMNKSADFRVTNRGALNPFCVHDAVGFRCVIRRPMGGVARKRYC